jgi:hypothetical protein
MAPGSALHSCRCVRGFFDQVNFCMQRKYGCLSACLVVGDNCFSASAGMLPRYRCGVAHCAMSLLCRKNGVSRCVMEHVAWRVRQETS